MSAYRETVLPDQGRAWWCRATLALLVVLIVWGAASATTVEVIGPGSVAEASDSDRDLYVAIVRHMDEGVGYYGAVAAEQGERGYPTRSVPTVREPVAAWLVAAVGESGALALLLGLVVVATAVGVRFLDLAADHRAVWAGSSILLVLALAPVVSTATVYFHEMWAAPLIVIGLMSRRDGLSNWWAAAALTLAALFRELAAPILLVVAVLAWRRGFRREACWMLVGFGVWASFYAWHAVQVLQHVPDSGNTNPGWLAFGGWPFVLETLRFSSVLVGLPLAVAVVVLPLAVLGWLARTSPGDRMVGAVVGSFLATLLVVGRDNNQYWGLLVVALVLPGLATAPAATARLIRGAARRVPDVVHQD